jgi:hypothetical protein
MPFDYQHVFLSFDARRPILTSMIQKCCIEQTDTLRRRPRANQERRFLPPMERTSMRTFKRATEYGCRVYHSHLNREKENNNNNDDDRCFVSKELGLIVLLYLFQIRFFDLLSVCEKRKSNLAT